jgi:hypothetical protein
MCILLSLLGESSGEKSYRGNEYILNKRGNIGRVIFYAVRVVSKEIDNCFFPELRVSKEGK